MLVLSRRPGESVRIGDDIVVKVVQLRDGRYRLGIDAPRDVRIFRSEIYEAIQREQFERGNEHGDSSV